MAMFKIVVAESNGKIHQTYDTELDAGTVEEAVQIQWIRKLKDEALKANLVCQIKRVD